VTVSTVLERTDFQPLRVATNMTRSIQGAAAGMSAGGDGRVWTLGMVSDEGNTKRPVRGFCRQTGGSGMTVPQCAVVPVLPGGYTGIRRA
jgi:hypothetical protein